ncbi:hypothetical protein [Catenulispora rubra]|uniref:hypothetical protein n=1 Tax=Catenulispora rubra TaxID=280293 RepID=UPI0018926239|nr:hypothetical protein [Catenulispora rubra]
MKELKRARLGAVAAVIVMLAAGACSSGKTASASSGATTPTPSTPSSTSAATDSSSDTSSASNSAASSSTETTSAAASSSSASPYSTPTAACPLVPASSFDTVSGYTDLAGQEIPTSAGGAGEVLLGCKYTSGSTMIGATTVDVAPAQSGESAQQYLSDDIASTKYNFNLSKDVSGVGDAAKFGTTACNTGTCASLWLVQVKSGMVAHLTVSVGEASGAEDPVIGLAKALLASVSH